MEKFTIKEEINKRGKLSKMGKFTIKLTEKIGAAAQFCQGIDKKVKVAAHFCEILGKICVFKSKCSSFRVFSKEKLDFQIETQLLERFFWGKFGISNGKINQIGKFSYYPELDRRLALANYGQNWLTGRRKIKFIN